MEGILTATNEQKVKLIRERFKELKTKDINFVSDYSLLEIHILSEYDFLSLPKTKGRELKIEMLKFIQETLDSRLKVLKKDLKIVKQRVKEQKAIVKRVKSSTTKSRTKAKSFKVDHLLQKYKVSPDLSLIVGSKPMTRATIVKNLWDYIKKNNLQNPSNRRNILADDLLLKIFKKKEISMFELGNGISSHIFKV